MTRPNRQYVVRSIRAAAREAIWFAMCQHEQGNDPNILLFATRRGGSTFAMELIAANRGIRPMNQPLETQSRNLTLGQSLEIPRFNQGQITSLDGHNAERMSDLMVKIFSGEVVINAPTKFWKSNVDMKSNRLVLKITDAKPMIDWFDTNVDSQIVYLTRHPIPQSLSCIRNDWTLTVDAHLNDPAFVETNLSDVAVALAHDVMRGDNTLQQFVLNWALENVAPMRVLADRPAWVHVRYEDCVTNPEDTLALLADRLHLTDLDRMRGVLAQPSQSSRRSTEATRADIEAGRGADTVTRWRDSIDDDDERRCNELLEAFGIDPRTVLPD